MLQEWYNSCSRDAHRRLDKHFALIQASVQLCPPGLKVCLDVLVIISVAPPDQGLCSHSAQSLVHPLADGAEVFVLLVTQPKDSIGQGLRSDIRVSSGVQQRAHPESLLEGLAKPEIRFCV